MGPENATHFSGSAGAGRFRAGALRLLAFVVLALAQIAVISYLFYFPTGLAEWANPVSYAKKIAQLAVLAFLTFLLAAQPRRSEIFGAWTEAAGAENWRVAVLGNFAVFSVLAGATVAFTNHVVTASEPPWGWFWMYCGLLAVNAASLALVAAPFSFWKALPRLAPVEIALAVGGALFGLLAGELSRSGWDTLSSATLHVSAWMLSLYESEVFVDMARKLLAVGEFRVIVTPECSGYEGVGLVAAFLAFYFWIFRGELRFPQALLLLPLGIGAIWLLNAVRIAALVSIGAHLSPAVAVDGFHSQAGWIAFVGVTLGLVATAHRSRYFRKHPRRPSAVAGKANRLLYALLLPFIALTASSIVAAAFAPNDQWLYGLKVAAIGGVLWVFRDVYFALGTRISPVSLIVGIAVGVVWIATDPLRGQPTALAVWLYALPPAAAAAWVVLRAFGSIILVPMAEELAFRGYLHRALIARRVETVAQGQFTWLAFTVSTVLFGLIHQRWLAAMLAGAAYAILMYRTGRLADPIAAHMASNAAIVFWAVAAGQWSLL